MPLGEKVNKIGDYPYLGKKRKGTSFRYQQQDSSQYQHTFYKHANDNKGIL